MLWDHWEKFNLWKKTSPRKDATQPAPNIDI